MRFLHTSDWQLGMTRHYLDDEAQARFSEARLEAIARMAELAAQTGCSFVVVAGDVFETNQPDARTVARAIDRLASFTVPVYLLPGNHDPFDPASIYRNPAFIGRCPANVEVLSDDRPRLPVAGVEVIGAPWTSKRPLTDLVGAVCSAPRTGEALRVVVGHGALGEVSGSFDDPATIQLERLEQAIVAGAVDYVALGDRHSCTDVGRTGRVWYSGAPEPTSYRELDAGTALVVELDRDRVHVERHEVGTWRFHRLVQQVDGDEDLDVLEAALDSIPRPACAIVKIELVGTLDLRQVARLDAMLEDRQLRFGALEQPQRHRDVAVRPSDDDLGDLGLTGYAAAARDVLQERATGEGEAARVASDALGLLLRLAGEGARR
jgi:DNA repair exonuclease SbcCD nuclease subunit